MLPFIWPWVLGAASLALSLGVSVHVLLHKREPSVALGWMGLVWLVPFLGAFLYVGFGVNRIKRLAKILRETGERPIPSIPGGGEQVPGVPPEHHWQGLKEVLDRVTGLPLVPGNAVAQLRDGNVAYPAMLDAIEGATRTVGLSTFILGNDLWGRQFVEALERAVGRGVEVRLLIDGAGQYYTWPPIAKRLRASGVPFARFLHSFVPWRMPYINLRNHRKILVVDGRVGFTGGMNLRASHVGLPPEATDLHFRVEGPVVRQMTRTFADDWQYTTRERLGGEGWFPDIAPSGSAPARGIVDGPDEDHDKCRWAFLAGLGQARRSVIVATPYFLPDQALVTALSHAALRGVEVDILLPATNNWPFVQWAANPVVQQVVREGCRVWMTPGPFDHSKYLVVDDLWCLVGSANWDPRSLQLNFEFNLETWDGELAESLSAVATERMTGTQPLTAHALERRPLHLKLRDGAARLLAPYM